MRKKYANEERKSDPTLQRLTRQTIPMCPLEIPKQKKKIDWSEGSCQGKRKGLSTRKTKKKGRGNLFGPKSARTGLNLT